MGVEFLKENAVNWRDGTGTLCVLLVFMGLPYKDRIEELFIAIV